MNEIDLDFGAIAIDNETFKRQGYKFNEGLLLQMGQFRESPVQVLQTDVVHKEAIKHIGEQIANARATIRTALRDANKHLRIESGVVESAKELLSVEDSDETIAEGQLDQYYKTIGAEILDSGEYVDLSRLMELYFSTKAPFETGKGKKNEFPDAITLLALDGWATKNDVNVVVVSEDRGWKAYSEDSERITLVASLADALEKFQPHTSVKRIISHIRADSLLDDDNHVFDEIENAIIKSIDSQEVSVEAVSYLPFDWDDVSAAYIAHDLDSDQQGLVEMRVVSINNEEIVLKVGALVEVEVEASFDFSIRDSIDKDYISLGSSVHATREFYHTDILLKLTGDFSQDFDNLEVSEVEVLEPIGQADFGEVEPSWNYEYEDDQI